MEAVFELAADAPARARAGRHAFAGRGRPDMLLLRRDVFSNGRSRCRINGHPVTVAQLAAVGEHLVDIHGQHDHQSLDTRPHPAGSAGRLRRRAVLALARAISPTRGGA